MRVGGGFRTCVGVSLVALALFSAGCSLRESFMDGAYGGVSDTVAGVISQTILGLLGASQ